MTITVSDIFMRAVVIVNLTIYFHIVFTVKESINNLVDKYT